MEADSQFSYSNNQFGDNLLSSGVNSNEPAILTGADAVSPLPDDPNNSNKPESNTVVPFLHTPFGFQNAHDYFSNRSGIVESAIQECISTLVFPSEDGSVVGSWLLTEISLWDSEKERIVILTKKAIMIIKYDFIAMKKMEFKRVILPEVDTIVIGNLVYPKSSLVPERNMNGVRVMWNRGQQLNFLKKWNPFDNDIPFNTFTFHPLYFHKESEDNTSKDLYDVENFSKAVVETVEEVQNNETPCVIHHAPILLQCYVGLVSLMHNKTSLGFFKVRGKFSF